MRVLGTETGDHAGGDLPPDRALWSSAEGRIFIGGLVLGLGWVALLVVLAGRHHVTPGHLLAMLATGMVAGRAGAVSMGQELGLPTWLIVVNATLADSMTVLLLYPLFVWTVRGAVRQPRVQRVLAASVRNASRQRGRISRYGILGLLLFVWFPLHMTGPLVGSIIGYFMGLNPYVNVFVVVTGTLLAVICWVALFARLAAELGDYSVWVPVVVILAAVVTVWIVRRGRGKEFGHDETNRRDDDCDRGPDRAGAGLDARGPRPGH